MRTLSRHPPGLLHGRGAARRRRAWPLWRMRARSSGHDEVMSTTGQKPSSPAMLMVSRRVKPRHEGDYRRWISRVIAEAEKFPNYLSITVLAPPPSGSGLFHHIHSFADEESLNAWLGSAVMRRLSHEADAFSSLGLQHATGMEAWFSLPDAPSSRLPRNGKWQSPPSSARTS